MHGSCGKSAHANVSNDSNIHYDVLEGIYVPELFGDPDIKVDALSLEHLKEYTMSNVYLKLANANFTSEDTFKIMLFQHIDKYCKVRDWICLQDQRTLSYEFLLAHCKQLEAHCEQFTQAQTQGRTHLTSITLTSANQSSLHANSQ